MNAVYLFGPSVLSVLTFASMTVGFDRFEAREINAGTHLVRQGETRGDLEPRLEITAASVSLKWLAETNAVYDIQWASEFQDWTNLRTVIGQGAVTNIIETVVEEKRFYRLVEKINTLRGLVAFYPFNGNANDESGKGNNGTVLGALLVSDRYGSPVSAYSFNGISSSIELPDTDVFNSESYSVSLWFNAAKLPEITQPPHEAAMLISKGRDHMEIHLGTPGLPTGQNSGIRFLPRLVNATTGQQWDADSAGVKTNEWNHLVATYDGSQNGARLFLNGTELTTIPLTGGDSDDSHTYPARLGTRYNVEGPDTGNPFTGSLDSVRIYSRVLKTAEVKTLFELRD